jgi:site-specific recombinase XerC
MINRQNWLDMRAYLRHIERVRQNDPETVCRARAHLRHLIEWADEIPLTKSRTIDPTFPAYMLTARADGRNRPLAPASISKCLSNARLFFAFARDQWHIRYKSISESWIEMLQPPRHMRAESRLTVHHYFALDDVLKIARVSAETLREERGQVAACILFLSAMRADALASLPISCVHLVDRQIDQLPEFGVRTKNRKAAITYLLDIPELFEICARWDSRLRALPPTALWYSNLSSDGMRILPVEHAYAGRNDTVEHDMRLICKRAGIPYQSPHKLRHGHAVYALKLARNMAEAKAISQNMMHASVVITDQVYGKMITDDVRSIIGNLGKSS